MVRQKDKRRKLIIIGAVIALLIAIGIVVLVNALGSGKTDPYKQVETTNTSDSSNNEPSQTTDTDSTPSNTTKNEEEAEDTVSLDPSTVSVVTIEPMMLAVSYVKTDAGFEYSVMRTTNGTQYVEFSSPELAGTKCTDDNGVFASIIEAPTTAESSTISKTTTVDSTKYGLSLADATCTKDPALLKQFQQSFSDAFSLLKRSDS